MFLKLKRADKNSQGTITINSLHIVSLRPFSSQNSNGVSDGTQINLSNGETQLVEESYKIVIEALEAVDINAAISVNKTNVITVSGTMTTTYPNNALELTDTE